MFKIEYVIPVIMSYHLLFLELLKYKKEEVSKNIVSAINGFVFMICHSFNRDHLYITHAVIAFYVYDLIYLIYSTIISLHSYDKDKDKEKEKEKQKKIVPYMVHHILTIIVWYNILYTQKILILWGGYYILEKSNIMLYFSYHIHKEYKNNNDLLFVTDFIQLVFYSYYRVIELSFYLYGVRYQIYEEGLIVSISLAIIYIMGIVWSYRLVTLNIKNYFSYTLLKHESAS
jgi:hypothetical protein